MKGNVKTKIKMIKIYKLMLIWTTLYISESKSAVFFPAGEVFLTEGNIVIHLDLNLRPIFDECKILTRESKSLGLSLPKHYTINQADKAIEEACNQVNVWPQTTNHARPKRFIGAIAGAILGGIGTELLHLFTSDQSDHMKETINAMGEELKKAREIMESVDISLAHMKATEYNTKKTLEYVAAATAARETIDNLSRGISSLISIRRVTADIVPMNKAENIFDAIQDLLEREGGSSTPLTPAALYQCEAILTSVDKEMAIKILFPLVRTTFIRYIKSGHPTFIAGHDRPLVISGGSNLAIAKDMGSFVDLGDGLAACQKLGGQLFCPIPVERQDWEGHCQAALFRGFIEKALEICTVQEFREQWAAERRAANEFVVITASDIPFKEVCGGRPKKDGVWKAGEHNVTIGKGCFVSAPGFNLFPAKEESITIPVHVSGAWTNPERAREAWAKGMREERKRQRQRETLLQQLTDDDEELPWEKAGNRTTVLCVVLFAVAIFLGLWARRHYSCARRNKQKSRTEAEVQTLDPVDAP